MGQTVFKHSERVAQVANNAKKFAGAVYAAVHGDYADPDQRTRLLILYMSMAMEHHESIMMLLASGHLIGSATALIRPLTETMVRGLWTFYIATPEVVEKVASNKFDFKPFSSKIDDLERFHGKPGVFTPLKDKKNWNTLNGLTHSGIEQLGRRIQPNGLVDTLYDEDEILETIALPTATLCLFALGFCNAVGRHDERKRLADLYRALFKTYGDVAR